MKTYDVVHYTRDGERVAYLTELEDYRAAVEHAECLARCNGERVVVEETPSEEPVAEPKRGFLSRLSESLDIAYVLEHTGNRK